MTESTENLKQSVFSDVLSKVHRRASEAGLRVEEGPTPERKLTLTVHLNGTDGYVPVHVSEQTAGFFLDSNFEKWKVLGRKVAVLDTETGSIHAQIERVRGQRGKIVQIKDIPGVEQYDSPALPSANADDEEDLFGLSEELEGSASYQRSRRYWRLTLSDDRTDLNIHLGNAPNAVVQIGAEFPRSYNKTTILLPPTLTIEGARSKKADEAENFLDSVSGSLFFDFDLKYGINWKVAQRSLPNDENNGPREEAKPLPPPRIPRSRYSPPAISLYNYGRSSSGLPLLEFLAYYQVIEHFFPVFSRQSAIRQIRQRIRDPRFDADDDAQVNRIFNIANTEGRKWAREREQLQTTVATCFQDQELRDFIQATDERARALRDKDRIKGAEVINLRSHNAEVGNSVANRVYDIRCRIVHSKEDGGQRASEPLLPFTEESDSLDHDIDLIRHIAQGVIVGGSSGSLW